LKYFHKAERHHRRGNHIFVCSAVALQSLIESKIEEMPFLKGGRVFGKWWKEGRCLRQWKRPSA